MSFAGIHENILLILGEYLDFFLFEFRGSNGFHRIKLYYPIADCLFHRTGYDVFHLDDRPRCKRRFDKTSVCYKTVYNYLDNDLFLNISNKDLPVKKGGKKRKYHHIRKTYNNVKGRSISERPPEIESRQEYGHWEMDTVVGKSGTKAALLVLSERKTREELIFKLKSKSQSEVHRYLDRLERKHGRHFSENFKTITCDNGCENLDFASIEKSIRNKEQRTKVYYAHPFSA